MAAQIIPFPVQKRFRIVGRPIQMGPRNEVSHFTNCTVCAKRFDMRDLAQVLDHYHGGPPVRWTCEDGMIQPCADGAGTD